MAHSWLLCTDRSLAKRQRCIECLQHDSFWPKKTMLGWKPWVIYSFLPTLGCCAQTGVLQEDNARLKVFNRYVVFGPPLVAVLKAFNRYGHFGPTLGCSAQIGALQEDNARLKAFNTHDCFCPTLGCCAQLWTDRSLARRRHCMEGLQQLWSFLPHLRLLCTDRSLARRQC